MSHYSRAAPSGQWQHMLLDTQPEGMADHSNKFSFNFYLHKQKINLSREVYLLANR